MAVNSLHSLRRHLDWAIQLEHATLPPYFCALYSIMPDSNRESRNVILSVMMEEMLHMALAANVLNAIGGRPNLDRTSFLQPYPANLPHSDHSLRVPLSRFSPATIETFMRIEKPGSEGVDAEEDHYHSIGQFYRAIEAGLIALCADLGEDVVFSGDPSRQVTAEILNYGGAGRMIAVGDLASALTAIDEIEEQGEGLKHQEIWDGDRDMFHPDRDEVAHYFRFMEIAQGRSFCRGDSPQSGPSGDSFEVDWDAVYPMRDNPRAADYPDGSAARAKMDAFNQTYWDMLRALELAFNGNPESIQGPISQMFQLATLARELMQTPTGDGSTTAGPSFEYMPPQIAPQADERGYRISILPNGPYLVEGGVPLVRKSIVYSEWGEPLTWRKDEVITAGDTYRLCRCGQSQDKPFCDGSHERVGFDGTQTAPTEPSATRAQRIPGPEGSGITMTDDRMLCADAGFCGNRFEKVWQLIDRTDESLARFQLMQMVERCPSGRLTYEIDGVPLEPDLPVEIAVTRDGPYWVTGSIPITLSDGRTLEPRNRVTICRCGGSANKPLCDQTHATIEFKAD